MCRVSVKADDDDCISCKCSDKYMRISGIIVTVVLPVILGLAILGTGLGLGFGMRKFEDLHLAFKILIPIAISVVVTVFASSQLAISYMFFACIFCNG